MKKFFSMLLLICISLSFFSACAKNPDILTEEDDGLDFSGEKFIILTEWYTKDLHPNRGGSASNDRMLDRFIDTAKNFNLVFDYPMVENIPVYMLGRSLSGNCHIDMTEIKDASLYDAYRQGMLLPAADVVNDADSDKWKSPANNAVALFGGKMYGIFPNYWEYAPGVMGMINVNLDRLAEYDLEDPHEIVEAGEWNWENFREFLKKITFNDGEREWCGMGMGINGVGVACIFPFVLSNGGHFVTERDGRYYSGIDSPEAMEAYEYIADLGANGLITEVHTDEPEYFNGLKWMATSGGPSSSDDFNMAQFRYPYGPHGNKDTVSTITYGFDMWAFPIFSAYTEDEVGTVAEYLFEPLDASVYPNGWKDIIEDTLFCYTSEYEYYIKAAEQAEFIDINILYDSFWQLSNAMLDLTKGNISPAHAVDGITDFINEEINQKYNRQK